MALNFLNNGYFAGKVGIGTESPAEKLEVKDGHIRMSDGYKIDWGGTNARIDGSEADNRLRFFTSSTERMRINSSGNVGIGTTSPSAKLHVNSSDATVVQRIQGATNSALEFYNSSTKTGAILVNSTQFLIAADNSNYLNINTGGSERMRITAAGNVGIGTTNPGTKLHISGGIITVNDGTGITYYEGNKINSYNANGYNIIGREGLTLSTASSDKDIILSPTGNVGIGTTSPTHLLTLEKASSPGLKIKDTTQGTTLLAFSQDSDSHIGTYSSHPLVLDTNSTERMRITSAGHVGIGTASPQAKLQVVSSTSDGIIVSTSSNVEPFIALWRNSGNSGVGVLRLIDGGNIYFDNGTSGAAQSTKMVITNAGNVGIGTTSPASKLDVQGGMSQFSTTLTNGEDWANSPISINERGQVGSAQSADKYAPNLNFHWAGRSSKSLWLNASGVLHFGEYSSTGIPDATGTFSVNTIALTGTGRITGVDTVSIGTDATSKTYVDNAITTATSAYLPLAGGTMTGTNGVLMPDNFKLNLGTSSDLQIYHDGSDSILFSQTGDLYFSQIADGGDMIFKSDDGSGGTTPYFFLDGSQTNVNFQKDAIWADNKKALFGGSGDLQIYHDGSNSYIQDAGAGSLKILAQDFDLKNAANTASMIRAIDGAQVELYYGGSKKFETSNAGVTVTGNGIFTGNVGIGTTSPSDILQVNQGSSSFRGITIEGTSPALYLKDTQATNAYHIGANGNYLYFLEDSNQSGGYNNIMAYWDPSNNFIFQTGNVGIGTTSPGYKLDVSGTIRGTGTTSRLVLDNTQGQSFQIYAWGSGVNIYNNSSTNPNVYFGRDAGTANNFYFTRNGTNFTMKVDTANERVGIGTTSPSTKLEVNGTFKATGDSSIDGTGNLLIRNQSAAGCGIAFIDNVWQGGIEHISGNLYFRAGGQVDRMTIKTSGRVGIGVTSPSALFEVNAADGVMVDTFMAYFKNSEATAGDNFGLKIDAGTNSSDVSMQINNSSGSALMRVRGDGNVGIGTTSPVYKLDVNGGARAGGVVTYSKYAGSLTTTGYAVAGLTSSSNGNSTGFTFTCFGHTGGYQKIVYSCRNETGTWKTAKVINEGTNDFDVEASADGTTITFTFKSTSGTKFYSPRVTIEATGHSINSTYA